MESTLSVRQREQFETDGYLIIRRMVPGADCEQMLEITKQHLRDAVPPLEYEAEVGYPGAPDSIDAPGGRTARRLRDAYQRHPCFQAWAGNAGLLAKLTRLMGEPVCLSLAHHNCVMTKHPQFGSATNWHRDIRYWSFTRPDLISVWLALGREAVVNGGLQIIPGSHRIAIAADQLDQLDFLRPESTKNQSLFAQGIAVELQQGDVVFFHSSLFHAAGKNASPAMKASVVFVYRGRSNLPIEGSKSAAKADIC